MDFDLMIISLPKLLSAAVITLKLLSASLIIGLFIGFLFAVLRLNKNLFINKFAYGYSYLFRGAIQSIDKGQFEAAKVLGVSKFVQFYKIILPQMLRLAIPNLSNVWQITLKDTSLISVTGLVEIMRQSYIAAGSTRDPLFFYCFAAVLYLMLTFLSMKLINRLEIKYSRGY